MLSPRAQDLLKHTGIDHRDYNNLSQAFTQVKLAVETIETSTEEARRLSTLCCVSMCVLSCKWCMSVCVLMWVCVCISGSHTDSRGRYRRWSRRGTSWTTSS